MDRWIPTSAHGEENPAVSVVHPHEPVAGGVHKLVAVPLQEAGVQVDPVAGDVDRHAAGANKNWLIPRNVVCSSENAQILK